jgi:hypothetical protein
MRKIKYIKTFCIRYQKALDKVEIINEKRTKWDKVEYPNWKTIIFHGIAKELQKHFPKQQVLVTGPHGIRQSITISIKNTKQYITLIHNLTSHTIAFVDYSKSTLEFPINSIGYVNGLNFREVTLPKNATLTGLARKIKSFNWRNNR